MPTSRKLVSAGVLLGAVAAVLMIAAPASAGTSPRKDSADFTYQYNGDTTPTDPTLADQFGNTGYAADPGIQNLTMSSDGNVLSVFPTDPNDELARPPVPDTSLNMRSSVWESSVIDDSTGFTFEFRLKLNATPGPDFDGGTLSRNRVLFRVGDVVNDPLETENSSAQIQIDYDGDVNVSDDDGNRIFVPIADEFVTFRMAQPPNSISTSLWINGELRIADMPRVKAQPGHWWGDFFGRTVSFDLDYIRFEPGFFAPIPEPTTTSLLLMGAGALASRRRR